jgi:hypothetical protein
MEPVSPEAIASIERYVARGGRLFMALDPEGKANNEALAAIAGLKFEPGILCHSESHGIRRRNPSDHGIVFSNRFSSHPSVSTLRKLGSRAVFFINAGSLSKAEGAEGRMDNVLLSLLGTWADLDGNFEYDSPPERKSTFNLATAVTRPVAAVQAADKDNTEDNEAKKNDANPTEARMGVVADGDVVSDAMLMNPSAINGNPQFVMDLLLWIGGDEAFSGPVAVNEDVRIEHTKQKDKAYFYLTIFGAPALVLGLGLTTLSLRRRHARKGRNA